MKTRSNFFLFRPKGINLTPPPPREKKKSVSLLSIKWLIFLLAMIVQHHPIFSQCTMTGYTALAPGGGLISNVGGSTLSGKRTVSADLIIDIDFTFSNCELRFAPGVKVTVNQGVKLTINDHSYLTACAGSAPSMWQGIEVYGTINNIAEVEVSENSIIEDAVTGIYLYSGYSNFYLDEAIFNRNYQHLYYNVNNIYSSLGSYVINSFFYCKDAPATAGNDCNCLLDPYANKRTNTCIFLNYCNPSSGASFPIGDIINSVPNGNIFMNAGTGIHSDQFNTVFTANYFENLDFGIEQLHNSRTDGQDNEFYHCKTGMRYDDVNGIELSDNILTDGSNGIFLTRTKGNAAVYNNTISGYTQGIRVHNGGFLGNVWTTEISQNNIASAGIKPVEYAIRIEESSKPNNTRYKVTENILNGVRRGILVRNLQNEPLIQGNPLIYVEDSPPAGQTWFGIQAGHCEQTEISDNYVYSNSNAEKHCFNNLHGIRNNASSPSLISCNSVEQTGRGFWFGGSNPSVLFQLNAMGVARNQFYLSNVPLGLGNLGGPSDPVNNSFVQTSGCTPFNGAYGLNSNNPGFTNIYYDGLSNAFTPVNNDMLFGAKTEFYSTGTGGGISCNPNPPDWAHAIEYRIALDTLHYHYDAVNYRWWDQYYLYGRLQKDTALLNSDTVYQNFKNTYSDSLIATLQMIDDSIAVLAYDSTNQSLLTWIRDTLANLYSSHTCAINFIDYDNILLNFIASGSLEIDSTDRAKLISIASQCPYTGGQSVFLARSLLSLINDTLDYDEGDCDSLYFGARYGRGLDENDAFILFPNPARNYITIEPLGDEQATGFDLYRADGQWILHKRLNAGETTLEFGSLASGLYFYGVSTQQGMRQKGKLCIIR